MAVRSASADLLLHPVRLRVVQRLLGRRLLTTAELRAELPDVSPATLYRQIATLVDAGLLTVASETRVRGAVERRYRLSSEDVEVDADDVRAMTPEDHRRAFTTFVAGLLADFDAYLDARDPDLARDLVGYRQAGFLATDEELLEALAQVRAALAPLRANGPGPGRRRRALTTVVLPTGGAGAVRPGGAASSGTSPATDAGADGHDRRYEGREEEP